jgi:hypothetical protein
MIVNLITSKQIADDLGHMFDIYLFVRKQSNYCRNNRTYTLKGIVYNYVAHV